MKTDTSASSRRRSTQLSRAGPALRQVRGGIAPAGWGVIMFAAATYVIGAALQWREAMIIAAGCLVVLAASLGWLWGRLGLHVERTLPRDHVMVGDRLVAEVAVTNPHLRPIGARTAEDQVGDQRVPLRIPALASRRTHLVRYVVPTDRRGVFTIGPLRVIKADPFGLFRREAAHGGSVELYVTPRIHVIETPSRSWTRDLDGQTFDSSPEGGTAFHALREYVRGDDIRHIHWRSTARTGTLMVRQYVDTRRPSTLLLLDSREDRYPDPELFELAVEIAASVAMCSIRSARPLAAYTLGTDLGGARAGSLGGQLIERFCAVQLQPGPADLTDLAQAVRLGGSDATETIIVTGNASADLLPLIQVASGNQAVVVRACSDAEPMSLPGCYVVDVGSAHEFVVRWNALVRR